MIALLLLPIAIWRVTSLLMREDGPLDIFVKLRIFMGVKYNEHGEEYATTAVSRGILCFWCTSIWVSAVLCIAVLFLSSVSITHSLIFDIILLTLSTSGIAIFIDEIICKIVGME